MIYQKVSIKKSKPISSADDTIFLHKTSKSEDFKNDINIVFVSLEKLG
jgi:hypothetical protein